MKIIKLIFCLLSISFPFALFAQNKINESGLHWRNDLNWTEIKALAKEKGKHIFLDCYATWCGPCKLMDKQVYSNDSIVDYFNEKFICVRLQMDTTSHDNETVKRWFALADLVKTKYKIRALPTLLFLSPDDKLLDKQEGYQNVQNLLTTAKAAPKRLRLYDQLAEYKNGEKDYFVMLDLADFAKKVIDNKDLSDQIANDYKDGYLNKLSVDSLLTKKHLQFVFSYYRLIHSTDRLFQVCYQYPDKVDSVLGQGTAMRFTNWLVTKEELQDRLVKDNKPVRKEDPDWRHLKSIILIKYPMLDCNKLVNDFCITYYRSYNLNWQKWAYYKNIRIKQNPPDYKDQAAVSAELNDGGAWDVFGFCNEKPIIRIALDWISLAIKLEDKRQPGVPFRAYLDTKANILYKLGDVNKAIEWEQKAIQAALQLGTDEGKSDAKVFGEILQQMKAGIPTYVKDGAIWDSRTLPVKAKSGNLSSK